MLIDMRIIPEGRSERAGEVRLDAYKDVLRQTDAPVVCNAVIDKIGDTAAADVRFAGEFILECARCLEDYRERVAGEFKIIIKETAGRCGAATGDDDEGVDFFFDTQNTVVDIAPAIYDEIMVSLPIMPLCADDCEGVAFDSGQKEEEGESAIDPRWEKLMSLKK